MKHPRTWMLIADGATARVVSDGGEGCTLRAVDGVRLEDNKQPDRDLSPPDRIPGRGDRAGTGRHGMEPRTDRLRVEHERFARENIETLEIARQQDRYDRLVLIAPPKMMGDLRDQGDVDSKRSDRRSGILGLGAAILSNP